MRVASKTDEPSSSEPAAVEPPESDEGWLNRWAPRLLAAYLFVSGIALLFFLDGDRWFVADEWDFLATRSATSFDDLMRPHVGHWTTLPILAFRAIFRVVGVQTYFPYQFVLVVVHLAVVWLLYLVLRRCEVRPWLAACVAAPLALFGPGLTNTVFAFEIPFVGALSLGFAQLLLADHEGPSRRRDAAAVLAGLGALMCAGVAVFVIFGTGVALLIRRGWQRAALQTLPLAAVYVLWYSAYGESQFTVRPSNRVAFEWARSNIASAFEGLGHFAVGGVLLAIVVVVGSVLQFWRAPGEVRRRRAGIPVGFAVAAVGFAVTLALTRSYLHPPDAERYVYVVAAMLLPLLAVAAEGLVERWRAAGPVLALLFLVPIIPNIEPYNHPDIWTEAVFQRQKEKFVAVAESPYLDEVPGWVQPDPGSYRSQQMTVRFVRKMRDRGKLPPAEPGAVVVAQVPIFLGFAQSDRPTPEDLDCQTYREPLVLKDAVGEQLELESAVSVSVRLPSGQLTLPNQVRPADGRRIDITLDEEFVVEPAKGQSTFSLCRAGGRNDE